MSYIINRMLIIPLLIITWYYSCVCERARELLHYSLSHGITLEFVRERESYSIIHYHMVLLLSL